MRHHGLNIVAIGGGTGLSTLLRGLKSYVDADGPWSIARLGDRLDQKIWQDRGIERAGTDQNEIGCVQRLERTTSRLRVG
ncbi:MAG: hypothetical protein QOE68_3982, partial [Thermoanaerobaculia bacterium]|nr:hypothetical protein [Thermoanaerobaculia bacterium]